MGFNKRELPELDKLKEIRQNIGNDLEFVNFIVGKSDVLMGNVDSYLYFEEIYERINKEYKNDK